MSSRRYTCLKTNWPLSPLTPESHTHTPHRLVLPVFVIQGDKTLWNVFGGAGGGESTDEWWAPSLPRPLQVVCIKRQREGKHSRASCFQGSHLCEQIISPTRAVSYGCLDVMLHCAGVPVQCRFSACRVVWLTHYSLWCWKLINVSRPGLAGVSLQHDFNVSLSLSWINLQSQTREWKATPVGAYLCPSFTNEAQTGSYKHVSNVCWWMWDECLFKWNLRKNCHESTSFVFNVENSNLILNTQDYLDNWCIV